MRVNNYKIHIFVFKFDLTTRIYETYIKSFES